MSPAKCAAWLLPFLLTGCFQLPFHKTQQAQNQALAPPIQPSQTLEVTSVEVSPELLAFPGEPIYNMREPAQPIRPLVRHKRPASLNPEDASSATDSAASPAPGVSAPARALNGRPH